MAKAKQTKLTKALLETAGDMERLSILSKSAHEKITKRHLASGAAVATSLSPREIKTLRKNSNMSQSVFAHCLNLTTGYVSQLERGVKKPTGPALILLNVIRRKGIEAIL
jgi:putative transcriptional regulator